MLASRKETQFASNDTTMKNYAISSFQLEELNLQVTRGELCWVEPALADIDDEEK